MAYDVHITRKDDWSDENGPRISEDEWRAYVASDPEMVMSGVAEHTNTEGETIRLTQPLLTEWRGHSSGSVVWFSYFEGNLTVKNPDDECIAKMRRVAAKLQAKVQGDEGEMYGDESKNPRQSTIPLSKRIAAFLGAQRQSRIEHSSLSFGVGDRVRDTWGNEHVVIAIDPAANHGTGLIQTQRSDGAKFGHAMFAHDLIPITKRSNG